MYEVGIWVEIDVEECSLSMHSVDWKDDIVMDRRNMGRKRKQEHHILTIANFGLTLTCTSVFACM
jgi:hypothetical protein